MVMLGLTMLLACAVLPPGGPHYHAAHGFGMSVQELAQDHRTQNLADVPLTWGSIEEIDFRIPVDAPLRSYPKTRNRTTYENVINQFAVEVNPRYEPRENDTYCMIFVWDITRAMTAEIPYWVGMHNERLEPWLDHYRVWRIRDDARWMSANDINQWLNYHGARRGWREVSAEEAQQLANLGHPTVASLYEPDGKGHIGIVRPGEMRNGPALAQAGIRNANYAHAYDFFPREGTQFFVNDRGVVVDLP